MSGSRRHVAIDLGASGGRVMEVLVSGGAVQARELHRFANAPVPVADAGDVRLAWPVEAMLGQVVVGLRGAARMAE
ncbi:MAG: rhamnulokinase, partial [Proteobacteria bacterium]|nr:rhamnulokinase [Pseudomonadota bacterium]